MTLDEFIIIVRDNLKNPHRTAVYKNAIKELAKNRTLLSDALIKEISDNGLSYDQIYNHYLFSLYSSDKFTIRLVFWKPVSLAIEIDTFIYNLKHNHDFEIFMTGYSGDGYETTLSKTDTSIAHIQKGDKAKITSSERVKLTFGTVIHMLPFQQIHEQHPPMELSSSLSLIIHEHKVLDGKAWSFDNNFKALHSGLGEEARLIFNKMISAL